MDPEEGLRLLIAEYSRMAEVYDRDYAPYHAPMVRRMLELARLPPRCRLLEFGCGTGILAFEVGRDGPATRSVVAIDAAPGMVKVASAKALRIGPGNVGFAVIDNRRLAFKDDAFDAVLSLFGLASLGHDEAFREAHRVLRDNGRFVLSNWSGDSKAPSVVGLLTRFRPEKPADDIRPLLEARASINSTGAPTAFGNPEAVVDKLRQIGFRETRHLATLERVVYPDAKAYLSRGLAMGDNEREFRLMSPALRAAFLRDFESQAAEFTSKDGFVTHVGVNYFVGQK